MLQPILLWQWGENPTLLADLQQSFDVTLETSCGAVVAQVAAGAHRALVIDLVALAPADLDFSRGFFRESAEAVDIPVVVISSSSELRHKLLAFEQGCDDYLDGGTPSEEVVARINKVIFHKIASEQLRSRLEEANATAYSVMSDNSDLGANIQFLLEANHCDNMDQLGQLFFSSLRRYGISASLQMRSAFRVKDMDANGMARDLESQLLMQMQAGGRYIDFGRRTIMNYGCCSVLVRNMPLDDPRRYGAIKDNTFALLQGVDARVRALDEHERLLEEKATLTKMSHAVKAVMAEIDESYQDVMRTIVSTVEDMAETIQERIPSLALSVEQEAFFEEVTQNCVAVTNDIFNRGLKVDETFQQLADAMDKAMQRMHQLETPASTESVATAPADDDDGVELF